MYKPKSGKHLFFGGEQKKQDRDEQKKQEHNRNRRNNRHTAFLNNRIILLTPKDKTSSKFIVKTQISEERDQKNRQIAFRDKFRKYLDNKKFNDKKKLKPFVSAVATGRLIDQDDNGKKNDRKIIRTSKPNSRRDLRPMITSTAMRSKKSGLVKVFNDTISPVKAQIVSSLPINETSPQINDKNRIENTSYYISPCVTISRKAKKAK